MQRGPTQRAQQNVGHVSPATTTVHVSAERRRWMNAVVALRERQTLQHRLGEQGRALDEFSQGCQPGWWTP